MLITKYIYPILTFICLLGTSFFLVSTYFPNRDDKNMEAQKQITDCLDKKSLTKNTNPYKLIVFLSSNCPYCNETIHSIPNSIKKFSNQITTFLFYKKMDHQLDSTLHSLGLQDKTYVVNDCDFTKTITKVPTYIFLDSLDNIIKIEVGTQFDSLNKIKNYDVFLQGESITSH